MDFLIGGLEIMFTPAIDFTGSNGNPSLPNSLHYNSPYQMNEYESAIRAIGSIVEDYDADKQFPCFVSDASRRGGRRHGEWGSLRVEGICAEPHFDIRNHVLCRAMVESYRMERCHTSLRST
jgi:hypothetical protein